MSDPRLTDERLRAWLQSQPERERLCIALLPLLGDYRDARPRRPRGGPDGARDIEARVGDVAVWGAVGFQNHADDSKASREAAKDKFRSDLTGALRENPQLRGFVFFTNVDLTPAAVTELENVARNAKIEHVEVFHRERLRKELDSTTGLALRLQFLGIEMSIEEQTAFVRHLSDSQDRRHGELVVLLAEMREVVLQVQKTATEAITQVRAMADRTIAAVTGGDSYCKIFVSAIDGPSAVSCEGEFPLYDVRMRFVDLDAVPKNLSGVSLAIGDLVPGHVAILPQPISELFHSPRRVNVFFVARNGSSCQQLRGFAVDERLIWASKITRGATTLEESVPDGILAAGDGKMEW